MKKERKTKVYSIDYTKKRKEKAESFFNLIPELMTLKDEERTPRVLFDFLLDKVKIKIEPKKNISVPVCVIELF